MNEYLSFLRNLDPKTKKISKYVFLTYFLALFSYPLVRSAVGAFFYEAYTASSYSLATFISITFLGVTIWAANKLQKRFSVQKLYLIIAVFSAFGLYIAYLLQVGGIKESAFLLFAIKESYIVLLIHLCLGFTNNNFNLEEVKKLFGPLGAMGSIGGILGGMLTSYVAKGFGTYYVFILSLFFIVLTGVIFYQTKNIDQKEKAEDKQSPLKAIKDVKVFVFFICAIVALTQWIIFIADLQFNYTFTELVTDKNERTSYLGNVYSYINAVSLAFQFIAIPFMMSRFKNKTIFMAIPFFYLGLTFLSLGSFTVILPIIIFVLMKASDYSIFAYSKEVMYHGLTGPQKYGTKYITDMFSYRMAKALIAFVMSVFTLKSVFVFFSLQSIMILLWIFCAYKLLKLNKA
ncbi:MAG: MFS transporter [Bacteriovoracaceae bacterium]|jgi:AAA family ATP:ADP antiporter|nr:MFS transporter [Bacteriovoracaceae bacterium]